MSEEPAYAARCAFMQHNQTLWSASGLTGCGRGHGALPTPKLCRLRHGYFGESPYDTLMGRAGGDWLIGGGGKDTLLGQTDGDELWGASARDHVYGGSGDDFVLGDQSASAGRSRTGDDVIHGGPGKEEVHGEGGADVIYGGDGDDSHNRFGIGGLYGGLGKDVIYGGDGDDLVIGAFDGGQRDELHCGEGRDEYLADGHDFVSSSCEVRFR